ncbi:hypothetical protein P5P86_05725 [Nocardioides sp. BP30]|uniref:hypothetical protein n=1 Tax=Nocardioides sp. BP30 TaxID=3036374 RepID=UPI002468F504|nr:hypothetical protein [Nocardioides sp. BP30]WGL53325.1 hypothetical protein P5P86_05725 [Nocardioides sp. BP30]
MTRKPWFLRGRLRYVAAAALVLDLGVGVFSAAMAVQTGHPTVRAAVSTTASTKTIKWTDDRSSYDSGYVDDSHLDPDDPNQAQFKDLQITVSQTSSLTDQGIQITWSGGKPTLGSGAGSNFLQVMQCWAGPGSAGPSPEQCQWGTPTSAVAAQTGTATAYRDLLSGDEADPKQDLGAAYTHAQFGRPESNLVPFWSITDPGKKQLGWTNDSNNLPPYGSAQSNEVTYARTAADGTGQSIFSLQSALSAPYLGCGDPTYTSKGYSCYLVVVPRGEYDPNGEKANDRDPNNTPGLGQNPTYVAGSPLSASAWQDRIQVKLSFTSTAAGCPSSGEEVQTAGSELISSAFSSWQSTLCASGAKFGFSQIGDSEARGAVLSGGSGSPNMDFVYGPVDADAASGKDLVYSPVVDSSIVVSYLIDKNYDTSDSDNTDLGSNGTLVDNLRLTPLLVAKLLTQSYRNDTPGDGTGKGATVPSTNPSSLTTDPEFIDLNPEFKYFNASAKPDGLIVPFGDSDAAAAVWAWLRADPAAHRFLSGRPDHWGTVINSAYKSLDLANDTTMSSFPKADQSTYQTGGAPAPGFGTIDMRPFSADFADGAYRTVTATSGNKSLWDDTKVPPQYVSAGAQVPGSRFELAITTSQAAALDGAPVASFVDSYDVAADDPGVGPTVAAMQKTVVGASKATSIAGVSSIDAGEVPEDGYPLTLPTYAVINVCGASRSDLTAYAKFLSYAAGAGQVLGTQRGQLPLGYAPLSSSDQKLASAAAARLASKDAQADCPGSSSTGGDTPTSSTSSSAHPSSQPSVAPTSAASVVPPGDAPSAGTPGTGSATASGGTVTQAQGALTAAASVTPAARYAVLAAMCFALPCLIGGPTLLASTRRKR